MISTLDMKNLSSVEKNNNLPSSLSSSSSTVLQKNLDLEQLLDFGNNHNPLNEKSSARVSLCAPIEMKSYRTSNANLAGETATLSATTSSSTLVNPSPILTTVVVPLPSINNNNNDHRISCHRCGNIRKRKTVCIRTNCPHTFCGRCSDKLKLEYGSDVFINGCPVCKDLCCCSNKTINCSRKFHCYRKCPATKTNSSCSSTPKNSSSAVLYRNSIHSHHKEGKMTDKVATTLSFMVPNQISSTEGSNNDDDDCEAEAESEDEGKSPKRKRKVSKDETLDHNKHPHHHRINALLEACANFGDDVAKGEDNETQNRTKKVKTSTPTGNNSSSNGKNSPLPPRPAVIPQYPLLPSMMAAPPFIQFIHPSAAATAMNGNPSSLSHQMPPFLYALPPPPPNSKTKKLREGDEEAGPIEAASAMPHQAFFPYYGFAPPPVPLGSNGTGVSPPPYGMIPLIPAHMIPGYSKFMIQQQSTLQNSSKKNRTGDKKEKNDKKNPKTEEERQVNYEDESNVEESQNFDVSRLPVMMHPPPAYHNPATAQNLHGTIGKPINGVSLHQPSYFPYFPYYMPPHLSHSSEYPAVISQNGVEGAAVQTNEGNSKNKPTSSRGPPLPSAGEKKSNSTSSSSNKNDNAHGINLLAAVSSSLFNSEENQ